MGRIAVFDSGIGGIGVLTHIRNRAPWADIVYLADHAFGAYGERTLDDVRIRTTLIAEFLRSAGVELVVVACNSASAAALQHLRQAVPDMVFVGMEPAVKPAAEKTRTGTIAVLATDATFQGDLFKDLVGRFAGDATIIEQPCPGLALAVERGEPVGDLLDRYLAPIAESEADVVVLGCTHYPMIRDEIAKRLPRGVELIDPAPAVASRTLDVAHEHGIDLKGSGVVDMWTTGTEIDRWDSWEWESVDVPADARCAVLAGETTLTAMTADITRMAVTAIVNAANVQLQHGGGVASAIARAGGKVINDESRDWIVANGPLVPGVAALTSAGAMPSEYVIHVAGPVYGAGQDNEELLAAAVIGALETATEIAAATVAVPAISAGIYGYPPDEAAAVIAETAAAYLSDEQTSLRGVRLVGFDDEMTDRFAAAITSMDMSLR
jgi:glutamate racemase